jgi:glycine/D-amino acid oxidase-like deaminating enzyme
VQQEATIVVGAGIIGLCTGVALLRAGRKVTILEMSQPGGGASFGNSGLISVDTALPMAVPGMLRQVPGWLADPTGPVTVKPSYAAHALPWLLRWVGAGRMPRVLKSANALRALHKDAFAEYRELLGPRFYGELIKSSGVVQLWETEGESRSDAVARELRELHGVQSETLSADELRQMFPGISPAVKRGLLLTRNGYTVSPPRLTKTLAEIFTREGGDIKCERVLKILPREGGRMGLLTNVGNHEAGTVVIAAGAWAKSLLEPLRVRLPLEAERGYHLLLSDCSLELRMPIMHRGRGFGFTPMEEGMCLAGTVEFAGVYAPPSEHRALILRQHGERLFPKLNGTNKRIWMGLRPSLPDSVPAIGRVPSHPGLCLAVGHGHYGMVGGPASARLLTEILHARSPSVDPKPYAVERFVGRA